MSYLSGFTVSEIGCGHELRQWASAPNRDEVQKLNGEIHEHNALVAELEGLTAQLADGVLLPDPLAVKKKLSEAAALGPVALALHESHASILLALKQDFAAWQAEKKNVLQAKRESFERKLEEIGLGACAEREAVVRILCRDEIADAFGRATVFVWEGAMQFFERSNIENAARMAQRQ